MTGFAHQHHLTPKQNAFLERLLIGSPIERAAKEVGISARTAYRWLIDPEFASCYQHAQHEVVSKALTRLKLAAGVAADKLIVNLANDTGVSIRVRMTQVRAACEILDRAVQATEIAALNDRLTEMETVMAEQGYEFKRGAHGRLTRIK